MEVNKSTISQTVNQGTHVLPLTPNKAACAAQGDSYGPWLHAARRPHRPQIKPKENQVESAEKDLPSGTTGSRFGALAHLEDINTSFTPKDGTINAEGTQPNMSTIKQFQAKEPMQTSRSKSLNDQSNLRSKADEVPGGFGLSRLPQAIPSKQEKSQLGQAYHTLSQANPSSSLMNDVSIDMQIRPTREANQHESSKSRSQPAFDIANNWLSQSMPVKKSSSKKRNNQPRKITTGKSRETKPASVATEICSPSSSAPAKRSRYGESRAISISEGPLQYTEVAMRTLQATVASGIIDSQFDLSSAREEFIPQEMITDESSKEVIHSMKRKTGKKGWMVTKVDLEKAYDRLKWSFIEDTLLFAGFPCRFTDPIMKCV